MKRRPWRRAFGALPVKQKRGNETNARDARRPAPSARRHPPQDAFEPTGHRQVRLCFALALPRGLPVEDVCSPRMAGKRPGKAARRGPRPGGARTADALRGPASAWLPRAAARIRGECDAGVSAAPV